MQSSSLYPLTALAVVSILAGCTETSPSSLGPTYPSFATRTDHNNDWEPFVLEDVDNPCTPAIEAIDFEGEIHGQGSIWDNGHFKAHYNVTLTGVDADGVSYFSSSTGNSDNEPSGSATEDIVISALIVSNGGTPNFVVKTVLHHSADGTVRVDKATEECQG